MTFPWEPDPFEQITQRMRELDVPEFLRRDANNRAPWFESPHSHNNRVTAAGKPLSPVASPPATPPAWVPPWEAKNLPRDA
jgi:hypothetical protein